jgi:GNAT superfamily N-acetyltransferase
MPSPASAASSAPADPSRVTAPVRVRQFVLGQVPREFAELSWTINARDPQWVPPLRMALDPLLNGKHPFHEHADTAFFVAYRGSEAVGRVAAVVNHRSNEFHEERLGTFGLFECADDAEAASVLLEHAAAWLHARGMTAMRGPFNLSTNDELHSPGVLIEGFDTPPVFLMGHNPPYYGRLMEAAGLEKAKDLVAYWLATNRPNQRLVEGMERLAKRGGWSIRPVNLKRFKEEVGTVMGIYNSAWERNWGFVPMTEAEFEHMAKEFRPVVDPNLCLIAEKDGEPIGFLLCLPDLNRAIKHIPNGKLFPFGVFKFLWHKRKIRSLRIMTLGMKPGYQDSGIGAALYTAGFNSADQRGYDDGEASWILEDNHRMCTAMEKAGGTLYKRYRIYERPL